MTYIGYRVGRCCRQFGKIASLPGLQLEFLKCCVLSFCNFVLRGEYFVKLEQFHLKRGDVSRSHNEINTLIPVSCCFCMD